MQLTISLSIERLENQTVTTKHAPEIIVIDDFSRSCNQYLVKQTTYARKFLVPSSSFWQRNQEKHKVKHLFKLIRN